MTYVYLIQKGYGSIKIGVASDPEKRLKELQTGNHAELHLIAKFQFQSRLEAFTLERELHKRFSDYRLQGEWFKKGILRKFKERAMLFPNIFCANRKGKFNSYHDDRP